MLQKSDLSHLLILPSILCSSVFYSAAKMRNKLLPNQKMKAKTPQSTHLCETPSQAGLLNVARKSAAKGQESHPDNFSMLSPQETTGKVQGYD